MTERTLKILRCKHHKEFKVCLAIFQHYEKVNSFCITIPLHFTVAQSAAVVFPAENQRKLKLKGTLVRKWVTMKSDQRLNVV